MNDIKIIEEIDDEQCPAELLVHVIKTYNLTLEEEDQWNYMYEKYLHYKSKTKKKLLLEKNNRYVEYEFNYYEPYNEGIIRLHNGKNYAIYNSKTNKFIINYEQDISIDSIKFHNGIAIYYKDRNTGLIDRNGNILVEFKNEGPNPFGEFCREHYITYTKGYYVIKDWNTGEYYEMYKTLPNCKIEKIWEYNTSLCQEGLEQEKFRKIYFQLMNINETHYSKNHKIVYHNVYVDLPIEDFKKEMEELGYDVDLSGFKRKALFCKVIFDEKKGQIRFFTLESTSSYRFYLTNKMKKDIDDFYNNKI